MSQNPIHPFVLEVKASVRNIDIFEWAIRKDGKLVERSDRQHRSEDGARKDAEKAIERLLSGEKSER